jgi:hypothetical protein
LPSASYCSYSSAPLDPPSLSTIVSVAGLGLPRVALDGLLRVRLTVSFDSAVASLVIGMLIFSAVWLGAKVSVPLVLV